MDITLALLALLFTVVGIIGCIVPALPGVILSYAGLLCSWFTSYSTIGTAALWIWLAVTVAVSVIDYYLPAWMTRRFGGSRSGAIGATVGVFGTITMNGVRMFTKDGLTPRVTTIVGTSVVFGLGIWMASGCLAGEGMPSWVTTVIGSNAITPAAIMAIILNLILPKPEK
jgi:uncharacterized protein YqgC (DUF456 family)